MLSTPKLPYTQTMAMIPVVGLRIIGRDRVHRFAECCSKDGTISIGRTSSRNIRIRDDDFVSKLHCVIRKNLAGQYEVVDFRSTNGVRVASRPPYLLYRKVLRHPLHVGMRIKIGCTKLVIVGPDGEPVIAVARVSRFGRAALSIFGSIRTLARRMKLPRDQVKKLANPDDKETDDE